MERLRRKRPTSNLNPPPDYAQGNGHFRNYPEPASDYSSCSSGIRDDDSFTFELGLKSSRQTPMKKLLAKEMSKESRRRSPGGVVAKLMGLDDAPPPPSRRGASTSDQHFKDVFEVPPDIAFIRQKFMDAKRLSTDHKLHDSKEFHDALDALDSNKDLLLKFLQQPDSLFAKHLHDLRGPPCARPKHHRPSHHPRCCEPRTSLKLSNAVQQQPTRIVVLKPNLGKLLKATDHHAESADCRKDREIPLVRKREVEVSGRRKFHRDGGINKSRELAKEITRQMRSGARLSSKGYAGDESSCSMSGNESANELEVASTSSKYSFDLSNHSRPLSSRSTESSVSREAKKRLSERWRLNHKPEDMWGASSRGSTLADMLAISDDKEKEKKKRDFDGVSDAPGFRQQPLGISSRDGWKDGCIANLTRSRSLPSSSTVFGSPKAALIREDRYVVVKERSSSKGGHKINSVVDRNLRSKSTTSFPSPYIIRESGNTSPETHTVQNQVETEVEVNSLPEIKLEDIESVSRNVKKTPMNVAIPSLPVDNSLQQASSGTLVADVCNEGDRDSLNPLQEPPLPTEPHEESPLPINRSVIGLGSPASSKEADQPSPVSVLAAPFTDDLSSCSDCFESLNADLQGLRMQLQLLKLESESYEEGPMVLSSDGEDIGEGSLCKSQQSWECSYIVDALIHSGLDNADPGTDVFMAAWHTPECPISPRVFEELEKEDYEHSTKSERRLVFNRVNEVISEMYPWAKSRLRSSTTTTRFGRSARSWSSLRDVLFGLAASQEKSSVRKAVAVAAGKVVGTESQWLEIGEDMEVIGGDIEKLLYDELVGELVGM